MQTAIDTAENASGGQVWVAKGIYLPTQNLQRNISFQMKKKVAIYGGFKGTEISLSQRNWKTNRTILSGDIGKKGDRSDNSYHVIKGSVHAILDGVTVSDGNANGIEKNGYGGGMFNWGYDASAIVRNTVFTNNYAMDGGAVFNFKDVLAYFNNVEITNNHAEVAGGLSARFGSSLRIENSKISNNKSTYRGGGVVVNYGSNVEFKNIQFLNNKTDGNGGAVWVDDQASQYGGTQPYFLKCHFFNNRASFYGGAIHNYNISTTIMKKNTFDENKAEYGHDVANTLKSHVTMDGNSIQQENIYTDASSAIN